MISKQQWEKGIRALRTDKFYDDKKKALRELEKALVGAMSFPSSRFGILFSGGIDSTLIAFIAKKLGKEFICYTVGFYDSDQKFPEDVEIADRVAKHFGFKHRKIILNFNEIEKVLADTAAVVGPDVVKVGVGAVLVAASPEIKKDGISVVYSGLGSEEIFAGYQRHKEAADVHEECWRGLLLMYDRDFLRDFPIAESLGLELKTPFLNYDLIRTAMQVPAEWKIKDGCTKYVLREVAVGLGIPKEFAFRKKRAAQYGSRIDKAIAKLASRRGFKLKKDYLSSLK